MKKGIYLGIKVTCCKPFDPEILFLTIVIDTHNNPATKLFLIPENKTKITLMFHKISLNMIGLPCKGILCCKLMSQKDVGVATSEVYMYLKYFIILNYKMRNKLYYKTLHIF